MERIVNVEIISKMISNYTFMFRTAKNLVEKKMRWNVARGRPCTTFCTIAIYTNEWYENFCSVIYPWTHGRGREMLSSQVWKGIETYVYLSILLLLEFLFFSQINKIRFIFFINILRIGEYQLYRLENFGQWSFAWPNSSVLFLKN